jgi:hypothetical protein
MDWHRGMLREDSRSAAPRRVNVNVNVDGVNRVNANSRGEGHEDTKGMKN